jgi:hypothetical protein
MMVTVNSGASMTDYHIRRLKSDDWETRRNAAQALGKQRDKQAVEPLVAVLKDTNWSVRYAASKALAQIGDVAVEPLIAALKDGNLGVRWNAAEALGEIGDMRAVEPLILALNAWDTYVRPGAAQALEQISNRNTDQFQDIWKECVCQEHFTRFIYWKCSISSTTSVAFFACRLCKIAEPSYRKISQVIAVLDMSASQPITVQRGNLLYVPWSLERGIFDFDAVEIRQATSAQIETFLLKFDEDEDPARPWKQKRGSKIQCRVLSNCPVTAADRARLHRHFEVMDVSGGA